VKIPPKIKIGGTEYTVFVHQPSPLQDTFAGRIDYDKGEIHLLNQSATRTQRIFWHEIIHGLLDSLGHSEHDEHLVDGLAGALHALVEDNPDMFEDEPPPAGT